MSQEYAESRIREALKQARGNTTKARQTIIAWAAEDQRLLLALARPHMTGIVAHAISRVLSRPETLAHEDPIPATAQSLNMAPDTFGKEILKALSSDDTPVFGLEGGSSGSSHRKKASQSHIDALKAMASKSRKK